MRCISDLIVLPIFPFGNVRGMLLWATMHVVENLFGLIDADGFVLLDADGYYLKVRG